ncbi:modulator of FtsH protease HflK [mine drainage metagenome]|uniref:Modulator of FtsH protease HflK n=1 Tax=mine drainage metagenome TaxID=410659 RepID=A0A1J5RTQ9_9ZZZZ
MTTPAGTGDLFAAAKDKLAGLIRVPGLGGRGVLLLAGLVALGWISSGIYKVQPDEQGVVLRFGRWIDTTEPGLHYHLPAPIDTVLFPKVTQINEMDLGDTTADGSPAASSREHQMLTGDENIVEADCTVSWQIKNAGQFLFNIAEPKLAVKVAAESALREIIGRTPIQSALSDKRQQIADQTLALAQQLLDTEQAGVRITQVQLQRVEPPSAVIDAFNDVQRARADQERARNEAQAYANDILPRAHGEADRITQEAEAYREQVVDLAQGQAKNFLAVYQSYEQSKDVTAWRLYMNSVDAVLKKASKVIVDSSGKGMAGVVPYLPLSDKAAVKGDKR